MSVLENSRRFFHSDALMYRHWLFIALLAATIGLNGCQRAATVAAPPPALEIDPTHGHLLHAQPKLPTIKVWVGSEELITEIASQPTEIATGMMFRTNMPENTAMIFIFRDATPRSFYMRNCFVPLSGAYMSTKTSPARTRGPTGTMSYAR